LILDIFPSIGVIQINIKRLIDEIRNGEHVLTPLLTRAHISPTRLKSPEKAVTRNSPKVNGIAFKNTLNLFKSNIQVAVSGLLNAPKSAGTTYFSSTPLDEDIPPQSDLSTSRLASPSNSFVYPIVSLIMSWGRNAEIEKSLNNIGLFQPPKSLSFGFRG
jgi:hypothetical protein